MSFRFGRNFGGPGDAPAASPSPILDAPDDSRRGISPHENLRSCCSLALGPPPSLRLRATQCHLYSDRQPRGMASWLLWQSRLQIGPQASYTLKEFTTLTDVLHRAGYVCGLSGKWHLGDNVSPQDGFSFWVTKEHGASAGFLNQQVLEDGRVKTITKHLSEYWTDRGIEFVNDTLGEHPDKPFFLFLAYNGPYSLSRSMREEVPSPRLPSISCHHGPQRYAHRP